jgi:hypothetical protein
MKTLVTAIALGLSLLISTEVEAQTTTYPGIRYLSPYSQSMGGVSLPLSQETGNNLFNNPAGLARNEMFKAEFLNLDVDVGSAMFGALGTGMTTLGGLNSQLNANQNQTYAEGITELTALSWGGFAVGVLYEDRVRAYSDGTDLHYQVLNELIPAVGYGLSLARGVVRLGYSLEYVNEASGIAQTPESNNASFLSGINQGHGFSNNASVNFVLPYQYLPTFSVIGRDIGGLRFSGGNLISPVKNASGLPSNEDMTVDAALGLTVRLSGTVKSYWFLEYDDAMNTLHLPFFERAKFGVDLNLSQAFSIRAGTNGGQFDGGIGFRSESSEINLTMYSERSPFPANEYWDTRYALQYKIFFQDHHSRDRESEAKGKQ